MNQILMVENKKKNRGSSGPIEIKNIVMFFAIALIIFGIFFIGQGSYAIYKESKGRNTKDLPVVRVERINDRAIITVNSKSKIENLIYSWNANEETKIPVENSFAETEVILPMEDSVLNIRIEEDNGRAVKYKKVFFITGMDIAEPSIEITEQGTAGSIKITATDETQMAYITYQINDAEEVRIDKSALEEKTMNYILALKKGENKIRITAVDTSGNYETVERTIIVSGRTSIKPEIHNGRLLIKIEDPDGVKEMEINLNGLVYVAKNINKKGFTIVVPQDLVQGLNTVKITVTNVNSLVTTGTKEFNYVK